jgi:hypothetical protein
MVKLDISPDGKTISLVGQDGRVQWTKNSPSLADWQRLIGSNLSEESLKKGGFLWVNGLDENEVTVVFQPYKGLDFNLTYSVLSGDLLKINEAR